MYISSALILVSIRKWTKLFSPLLPSPPLFKFPLFFPQLFYINTGLFCKFIPKLICFLASQDFIQMCVMCIIPATPDDPRSRDPELFPRRAGLKGA